MINATYTINIWTLVWYNVIGYIWNISDAFPFFKKKGGGIMTKREISQFIIILLLFFIVITLLFR